MSKFKPGQKVVCIRKGRYIVTNGPMRGENHDYGPTFNEIVTIDGIHTPGYVILTEYKGPCPKGFRHEYQETYFEPLVSDAVLRTELESVPEPYTL